MKKLSSLKLSSIVFGIFMLLPMFSILSRVIYIQSNPNAKDSYYGETINENQYISRNYFNANQLLIFNKATGVTYNDIITDFIACDILEFNTSRNDVQTWYESHQDNIGGIRFVVVSNQVRMNFYDLDNTYIDYWGISNDSYNVKMYTKNGGSLGENYNNFYTIEYNDYSYLDNVFDYSLHTFLEDENNYSINFFDFFGNTFLNQSGKNMLYLNFLNWYMNYGLLVSSGYILFFILYFFINVIRKLVLSFTNKIDGGF